MYPTRDVPLSFEDEFGPDTGLQEDALAHQTGNGIVTGPFLGSEFAFEDLSSFEVEKNTYNLLREEE